MPITKAKLLITDNDPAIREILSVLLAEVGYQVRAAEDGFTALAEIRMDAPDILLSDLNMPGMSGFELLCLVRNQFPGIKTIAMSGMFSSDQVPPASRQMPFIRREPAWSHCSGSCDPLRRVDGPVPGKRPGRYR